MVLVFTMIPGWAFSHADAILGKMDRLGDRLALSRVDHVPLDVISEHYSHRRDAPYYQDMVDDYNGNPVIVALYDGDRVRFAELKETLRKEIPLEPPAVRKSAYYFRIPLHTSRTLDEFVKEWEIWKGYFNEPGL